MSTTLPPAPLNATWYAELLGRTLPRVIRSAQEHERLTAALLELDEREDLTPEEEKLAELLTMLVTQYEDQQYSLERPTPQAMLLHLMEARGLAHEDVWTVLGSRDIASEVLNGKRAISKAQAHKLAEFFHVSADVFV